jgi:hypothetical protein
VPPHSPVLAVQLYKLSKVLEVRGLGQHCALYFQKALTANPEVREDNRTRRCIGGAFETPTRIVRAQAYTKAYKGPRCCV